MQFNAANFCYFVYYLLVGSLIKRVILFIFYGSVFLFEMLYVNLLGRIFSESLKNIIVEELCYR